MVGVGTTGIALSASNTKKRLLRKRVRARVIGRRIVAGLHPFPLLDEHLAENVMCMREMRYYTIMMCMPSL